MSCLIGGATLRLPPEPLELPLLELPPWRESGYFDTFASFCFLIHSSICFGFNLYNVPKILAAAQRPFSLVL